MPGVSGIGVIPVSGFRGKNPRIRNVEGNSKKCCDEVEVEVFELLLLTRIVTLDLCCLKMLLVSEAAGPNHFKPAPV